jgi:methylase of polypeptide subunit release factors
VEKVIFLTSAVNQFPNFEKAIGFDINLNYVEATRSNLKNTKTPEKVIVEVGDFFTIDWIRQLEVLPDPILIIGNPPWVTNSRLGLLGSTNLPKKSNFQKHTGLHALTGKSNFDISEWMLLKMLDWLNGKKWIISNVM